MSCDWIEELLSPYLEDGVSAGERKTVEEHLRTCPNCASLLASLKDITSSLAGFPEVKMSESLLDRLSEIPLKKRRFIPSFDFLLRPSLQPLFAAATVFLILISFYAFSPHKRQIDRVIGRQIHLGYSKIERLYVKAESFTGSLAEYKDNLLVSLQNRGVLRGGED